MSFPCSCSCTQFGFSGRHEGKPATQGGSNHTPYFPQTDSPGERRVTQGMDRMSQEWGRSHPSWLSTATERQEVWCPIFPSSAWTVEWYTTTKPVPIFSLYHILAHLDFKGRGMQLCWPDNQESLKFVTAFVFQIIFPGCQKGKSPRYW